MNLIWKIATIEENYRKSYNIVTLRIIEFLSYRE
jgi:hypothetical protein